MQRKRQSRRRLFGFDYSKPGSYFVTTVVMDRKQALGEIIGSKMFLSAIGAYAEQLILAVALRKPDIRIDEYQIMPDHVHMIVTLRKASQIPIRSVSEGLRPLHPGSLSSFVNHFKGKVTRWCNDQQIEGFAWQPKFHDRVIRDANEYCAMVNYIRNNVRNWTGGNNNHST